MGCNTSNVTNNNYIPCKICNGLMQWNEITNICATCHNKYCNKCKLYYDYIQHKCICTSCSKSYTRFNYDIRPWNQCDNCYEFASCIKCGCTYNAKQDIHYCSTT